MVEVELSWTSTGSSGALTSALVNMGAVQTALYCEASTIATTQSFAIQTAAHSTGPWVTEGSTSVGGGAAATGAAVLRLTGPFKYVRPYLNSASTGNYTFRLLGAS